MTQIVKFIFYVITNNIIFKYMDNINKKSDTMYKKIYKLNKLSYISISDEYEKYYKNYPIIEDFDLKKTLIFENIIDENLKRNSFIIFNYSCYYSNINSVIPVILKLESDNIVTKEIKINIGKSNKIDIQTDITLPFNVNNIKFKLSMISNIENNDIYFTKKKIKFIIFSKL